MNAKYTSSKKRANRANEKISTPNQFRRLIHSHKDIYFGLSYHRTALDLNSVIDIFSELMKSSIYRNYIEADPYPKNYAKIKTRIRMSPASAEIELIWTSCLLAHHQKQLSEYILLRDEFNNYYLGGKYPDASAALELIEATFGYSIWLINAKLMLAQASRGVAEQKEILREIVQFPKIHPMIAYLAYFFSYSIEDGSSYYQLKREANDAHVTLKDYVYYHLMPFEASSIVDPQLCLINEENSPIIDKFENFLYVVQIHAARNEYRSIIKQSLSILSDIPDARVQNLKFMIGLPCKATNDEEFIQICNYYSIGLNQEAHKAVSQTFSQRPGAAWYYEIAARVELALAVSSSSETISANIVNETASFLEITKDLYKTRANLRKLAFRTRSLPASIYVGSLLERALEPPIVAEYTTSQVVWMLTSPNRQPYNYSIIKEVFPDAYSNLINTYADEQSVVDHLHFACSSRLKDASESISKLPIPDARKNLFQAYAAYNCNDLPTASGHYKRFSSERQGIISPRSAVFNFALLKKLDDLDSALQAFSEAYFANPKAHALYRLLELTEWAVAEAMADRSAIDRAILLHAYSDFYDDAHDGDLSDSLEDVLDFFEINTPIELVDSEVDIRRLTYFLANVATIDRLEDTTRFVNLTEIERERIRILQWLVENDTQNRSTYTQEISSITKDMEVARLSAQFERSKIYVHEEGIRRSFESEVKPLFYRYRENVANPSAAATADLIEKTLRRVLKEGDSEYHVLVIPSSERDSMYFSMLQRAFNVFVLDPNHGFKTYLSTRILHGVLEGELRSSFIAEGLILPANMKPPVIEYSERWALVLDVLKESARADIIDSAIKFAEKVTEIIIHLKDNRIRIYEKEHPNGLFKISVKDEAFTRLKNSVTPNTTYEEFLDRLFATFWDSIDACLRNVKYELHTNFNKEILAAFASFETSVINASPTRNPSDLIDTINRCRAKFSVDLNRVSSWFSRAGVLPDEPFSANTAVTVALLITNNCYPRHPISIDGLDIETARLSGKILNPLVDLLTNCLQNAAEHSGFQDRAPKVNVAITINPEGGLNYKVTSEVSDSIDLDEREKDIRNLLLTDDYQNPNSVAGEGRTGIRKMKRILNHDFQSNTLLIVYVAEASHVVVEFKVPQRFVNAHSIN